MIGYISELLFEKLVEELRLAEFWIALVFMNSGIFFLYFFHKTLSGEATLPISFLPNLSFGGLLLKGKNLLLEEQILCFKRRPHLDRVFAPENSKQEEAEVVSHRP